MRVIAAVALSGGNLALSTKQTSGSEKAQSEEAPQVTLGRQEQAGQQQRRFSGYLGNPPSCYSLSSFCFKAK